MVALLPAGVIFIPIAFLAARRRRWALILLAISVPFFGLTVLQAVSHEFHAAEIAVLALGINQFLRWTRTDKGYLPWPTAFTGFSIFITISALSIVYAIISPADILVNQYGVTPDDFNLVSLSFGWSNVTQFMLRLFTIGAIVLISMNIDQDEIPQLVRLVVLGGIFSGVIGVLYQFTVFFGIQFFQEFLQWFGEGIDPGGYGFIGPIPRMGSVSGEPGHTSQYLLYTFTIVLTLLMTANRCVFKVEELIILVPTAFILLLATTSTTGYGGFLVMSLVLFCLYLLRDVFRPKHVRRIVTGSFASVFLMVAIALFVPSVLDAIRYQIEKLQFQAGSGQIRLKYINHSIKIFVSRPIIGAGTGSYYSTSLIGTLLVENGILGLGSFIWATTVSVRELLSQSYKEDKAFAGLAVSLSSGLLTLLLTSLVAKSISTLLSPWFWFAVALPIALVQASSK